MFRGFFILLIFCFCASILLVPNFVFAQNQIEIDFFHSPTCSHCKNLKAELNNLKEEHAEINIIEYDVYTNTEDRDIYNALSDIYDQQVQGVPIVLINDKLYSGDSQGTITALHQEIDYCLVEECDKPSEKISAWLNENPISGDGLDQKVYYTLIGIGIILVFIIIFFIPRKNKAKEKK